MIKRNENALVRMRQVLKYEETTGKSIFNLNEEYTISKLVALGYSKEVIMRSRAYVSCIVQARTISMGLPSPLFH